MDWQKILQKLSEITGRHAEDILNEAAKDSQRNGHSVIYWLRKMLKQEEKNGR